jgi:hypothetical protein
MPRPVNSEATKCNLSRGTTILVYVRLKESRKPEMVGGGGDVDAKPGMTSIHHEVIDYSALTTLTGSL